MPEPSEFDLQKAFTIFFKGERWAKGPRAGTWKVEPAGNPLVVAWHTPNGGTRSGGAFEGKRLNESGVEAGIPDYLFLFGGLYGLEFKAPGVCSTKNQGLRASQIAMHPRLLAAGMIACETIDSLEDAKAFVRKHGLVIPGK